MPDTPVSATFVISTGPFARRVEGEPQPWAGPEVYEWGVIEIEATSVPHTIDMDEDIKISYTVRATSPEAVRRYAREVLGLTEADMSWGEMERQIG